MEDSKKIKKNKNISIDLEMKMDNQELDKNIAQEEYNSNAMLWGCVLGFILFLIVMLFVVIFVR